MPSYSSSSSNQERILCVRSELLYFSKRFEMLRNLLSPSFPPPPPLDNIHPRLALRTAQLLHRSSSPREHLSLAVQYYEKSITLKILDLPSLNIFSSLIDCLSELNEIEKARSYFSAAALSRVEFVELQKRYGIFLASNGFGEEAEIHLLRLSKRYPKVAEYHVALTYVLELKDLTSTRLRKITEHLQLALMISPNLQDVHLRIGKFLMMQSRYGEATKHLQHALREYTDENDENIKDTIISLANALVAQGHFKAAIHQYERILVLNPESVSAHSDLAWALLKIGSLKRAESRFRVALRLEPTNLSALRGVTKSLLKQYYLGRDENDVVSKDLRQRVVRAFVNLLEQDPRDVNSYFFLSRVVQDLDKSMSYLKRALDINPNWAVAHHELAGKLFAYGETRIAITHYEKAVRYEKSSSNRTVMEEFLLPRESFLRFRKSLATAYEETGQVDNSIRVYEAATKM